MPDYPTRLFAVDPFSKGIGYAVLDLPSTLAEFGLARVKGDKNSASLAQFEKLIARYHPDAVALEDAEAPGSRRCFRVRKLIGNLVSHARERGLVVHTVPRTTVRECLTTPDGPATKYAIAQWLANCFPELRATLPPRRKLWQAEDERSAIFDALAFAVTATSI